MAKAFKIRFTKKVYSNSDYQIPEGYEIQVSSNSSIPQQSEIIEALEKAGIWKKSFSTSISGAYTILS
jgi:hypothetical protein